MPVVHSAYAGRTPVGLIPEKLLGLSETPLLPSLWVDRLRSFHRRFCDQVLNDNRKGRNWGSYLSRKAVRAAGCACCAVPKTATKDDHCHLPTTPWGVRGEHIDLEVHWALSRSRRSSTTPQTAYTKRVEEVDTTSAHKNVPLRPRSSGRPPPWNKNWAHSVIPSLKAMGHVAGSTRKNSRGRFRRFSCRAGWPSDKIWRRLRPHWVIALCPDLDITDTLAAWHRVRLCSDAVASAGGWCERLLLLRLPPLQSCSWTLTSRTRFVCRRTPLVWRSHGMSRETQNSQGTAIGLS